MNNHGAAFIAIFGGLGPAEPGPEHPRRRRSSGRPSRPTATQPRLVMRLLTALHFR